jgi:hypothetical protein
MFFAALQKMKHTATGEFDEASVREQITQCLPRPFRLRFDAERLRENAGFRAVRERRISIDELSGRGRKQLFAIIKKRFLFSYYFII